MSDLKNLLFHSSSFKNSHIILMLMILTSFSLISCLSSSSNNPEKVYKYWLKEEPPKELKLINGQYYQSPHFTLEYEVFLEMNVTKKWWDGFIRTNHLKIDSVSDDFMTELPKWFKVNSKFTKFSKNDKFDRSAYYINFSNGKCFIYETVGL